MIEKDINKMRFKLVIALFAMLAVVRFSLAQCPTSTTVTTTESRCKENGTITINAVPAAGYVYEIISGPTLSDPTTSNVFTSLGPGNYTIEISRGGCVITVPATVAGNYIDPGLITMASIGKIACPGGKACATANQPSNGRLPWKYSIVAGPVVKPIQSSPSFCELPNGTYSIQALDSCGVVRTTQFTIGIDTGNLTFQNTGSSLLRSSCTDIVLCPTAVWNNTSSHSLVKVWYIKPNGDTLKTKNFRSTPIGCDTLYGEAKNYGTWKAVAWDTCGRKWQDVFTYSPPSLYVSGNSPLCSGYQVNFGNMWRYGISVGYTVRKCRDNSIVYSTVQTPPSTTFYSPNFQLEYDTCYIFEHYNECGDTVRYKNFSTVNTAKFNINACGGPGCKNRGTGHIKLYQDYRSGIPPVTFTILDGPQGIGSTTVQVPGSSWTSFQNMLLGTYTIAGIDACGSRDTVTVTLNKPLIKSIDVTQVPNCSGGANLHIKITSNYIMCDNSYVTTGFNTVPNQVVPAIGNPLNIIATPVSQTTPGTWEGDYNNVLRDSIRFYYYAYEGCVDDTVIKITQYKPPSLSNTAGYVCGSSGTGTLNYSLSGGKPPYRFRVKPDNSSTWGPWQDSAIFPGISAGAYDINVEDGCPNGAIRSATFYSWEKSDFNMSAPCAEYGDPFTLTVNPPVNYAGYRWYRDNTYLGTGPSYTIPSFSSANQGRYTLQQVFKNGGCTDSTAKWVVHCSILSLLFGDLSGTYNKNDVTLQWNTLRDAPGSIFNIERSVNGSSFKIIGNVQCLSSSSGSVYHFTDAAPLAASFYRIRYISPDGKKGYSNTIGLKKNAITDDAVKVSPVPFKYWFTITIRSAIEENCSIRLFNIAGKPVYKRTTGLKKGNNTIWVDDDTIGALPAGVYILETGTENTAKRFKIMKQ